MALSRKMLEEMGIDERKVELIVEANAESIEALKKQRDDARAEAEKYKADAEKLPIIQKELDEIKKTVDTGDSFKQKYDEIIAEHKKLQKEYDAYREETENKETRATKEQAFKDILKDAGIPEHHHAKIIKYSDIDGLELDDKGKVTTAKDILKNLKEEWGDHIEKESIKGAETANPPASTEPNTGSVRDYERIYHQNLYGKAKED